jgi:TPR repeat protein
MKPRSPGFWLVVATVGLLALLPMKALAGMTPEEVKLFRETKAKADQGDLVAQNSLGLCYYFGRGVAKDYVQAVNLWRKGANQGDAYAQHLLAHRYATGEGVAKDSVQAVNLWRKSADQGNAKAQFELGNSYATGEGVAKNAVEAAKWYRKSADQGYAAAAKSLDSLNRMTPSKGTPPTETTVTTLDGARVVITKKGNITNVETVGNLSPNTAFTGNTLAEIKPENNPVDLLIRAVELFPQNQRAAYQLGLAARLRAQFDQKRVSNQSAHQAYDVLTMQPANERVLSWGAVSQAIGAEEHRAVLEWARKSGPPTYHPAWMIQHGMGVFGASSRAGAGLNADFVAASAWSQVLDDYAKFIDTPSFWVTRQERNSPANFPTLLKMMESRYLSELDSGPAGEVGRQKLRAVVVGFDLKAANPALAFLDARDAMQAIVSTPNSAAPANGEVKTFEDYRAKAEQGQAEAQYYLGMIYRTGSHGVAKDVPVSVTWLTKSAEQGHSRAQYYLGRTYFDFDGNTSGVAKDTPKAVSWWGKAAAQGDADAQEAFGFCYAKGFGGLVKNEIEAYAYQILASRSNASAMAWRGKLEASLSPESLRAGVARSKVLQTAPVVTANSAAPASGVKAPPAEVKAIQDLKAKAAKGDRTAQFTLGINYANGSEGLARDSVEAVKWYRMAADQGHVTAQYYLGRRYASGSGVAKDIVQAVAWYRKAADQGYAEAQFKLGTYYSNGVNATPNQVQAFSWYRKAADQGFAEAQYILGNSYTKGEGVAKDHYQAMRWYRKAAEQGFAMAQLNLGNCYYSGTPALPKDFVQAAKWWRKVAEQGNPEAQFKLGNCYASGEGVTRDDIEAYAYWSIAGITFADARTSLDILEKRMLAVYVAAGQKRTKELKKELEAKKAAVGVDGN